MMHAAILLVRLVALVPFQLFSPGVSSRSHRLRRSAKQVGTALVVCAGVAIHPSAGAQPTGPVLLRQLYGDLGLEVRSAEAQAMYIGAADGQRTIAVLLLARDVRRWADSASRVLASRLRGKEQTGRWAATVEEPGSRSGSMMLSRSIEQGDTVITVFLADNDLNGVRTTIGAFEARAFVGAMKRVADAILFPTRPKGKGGVRR